MWTGSSISGQSGMNTGTSDNPAIGYVDGEDVGDGLLDVVEDAPSELHGVHDGGKVIVQQHERAAASRATSVPRPPMAMPMCAAFSAGASFTPSPVMATISPVGLQRVDDPQLLLGHDAREDIDAVRCRCDQLVVAHRVKFRAGDHLVGVLQADLLGDALRRAGVVAR